MIFNCHLIEFPIIWTGLSLPSFFFNEEEQQGHGRFRWAYPFTERFLSRNLSSSCLFSAIEQVDLAVKIGISVRLANSLVRESHVCVCKIFLYTQGGLPPALKESNRIRSICGYDRKK